MKISDIDVFVDPAARYGNEPEETTAIQLTKKEHDMLYSMLNSRREQLENTLAIQGMKPSKRTYHEKRLTLTLGLIRKLKR